jgi:hypothetical protein
MSHTGIVKNGGVVLAESAQLPEGAEVRVELPERTNHSAHPDANGSSLAQELLRHAGKAKGLPADASSNLDHYLYGTPKR